MSFDPGTAQDHKYPRNMGKVTKKTFHSLLKAFPKPLKRCLPVLCPCPPPRPGTPRTRRAMRFMPFACPRPGRATWPPGKASFPRSGSPRPWK